MGGKGKATNLPIEKQNKELFTSFGEIDNSIDPKNFSFGDSDKEDSFNNNNNSLNRKIVILENHNNILYKNSLNAQSDNNFSFNLEKDLSTKKDNYYLFKQIKKNEFFEVYLINKNEIEDFKAFIIEKYPKFFIQRKKNKINKTIDIKQVSQFDKYSNRFKLMISCYCERKPTKHLLKGKYLVEELIDESTFSYIYLVSDCYAKDNSTVKKMLIAKKIKSNSIYFDQSVYEIYILSYLKKRGNCQKYNILEIQDYFYYNVI